MNTDNFSYTESNKVTEVINGNYPKDLYRALLNAKEDDADRLYKASGLANAICKVWGVPAITIHILGHRQEIQRGFAKGQRYGFYAQKGAGLDTYISLYNYTAKTHKIVSIKSFADTLLHEMIHHYDINVLKLTHTPHTSGFYQRIGDLKKRLEN